ncbi:MAG TPA: FixH family protein [Xanthomonadaceae bacterium]|nr:FixH family protein [Xanthomonadaceae bacterium]
MVWLVIGIPLATVIAGLSTVATAIHAGNVDSVIDPVKRTGTMQEFKMSGDRAAARLGLTAEGHVDADTQALRLRLAGDLPSASQLRLTFAHPVRTSEDRSTLIIANGNSEFLGRADIVLDHDWNLILAPEDGSWRLVGRFVAHASAFELRPALPGD